jgi:diguanylate cyclase (GGDEF)-like protein
MASQPGRPAPAAAHVIIDLEVTRQPPPHRKQPPAIRTIRMDEGTRLSEVAKNAVRERYRPAFVVLTGSRVGERASLSGNALLGRDPDATVVLNDPGVSWHHAVVQDRGEHYVIVDLESTNGTRVNDVLEKEAVLSPGDKVRLGSTTLRFEIQDEHDEAFTDAIAQLVNIDDLTGLYLRRRFDRELDALVATARTTGAEVGLLAMDLDGVKAINDEHGHLFGAYTIAESGKLIGEEVRDAGFACRFGGDEFIAALPDRDLSGSVEIAERIHARIGAHRFEHEGVILHAGISIGVATFPTDAADALSLFKAADSALYEAKRTGKNRVCTFRT